MQSGNGDKALADFLSKTAKMRRKLKKVAYKVLQDAEFSGKLLPPPPRALGNSYSSESKLLPLAKQPARQSPLRLVLRRTSASPFRDQFGRTATDRPLFHILEKTSASRPLQALRKSLTIAKVNKVIVPAPPLFRRLQSGQIAKISPGRSSVRSVSPYLSARSPYSPVPGFRPAKK